MGCSEQIPFYKDASDVNITETELQRCGEIDMIRSVILHCTLHKWVSTCAGYKNRTVQAEMFDPLLLCYPGGGISPEWFDLRVTLEERVITNQYAIILIDHVYPMRKHFCPDGSGLLLNDNDTRHMGSMKMILIFSCQ